MIDYVNRKNAILVFILIGFGFLLLGGNQLFKYWRYQRSFMNEVWNLDETHQVHYGVPPNWEVDSTDEVRIIHLKPLRPDATDYQLIWLRIMKVSPDDFSGTDLSNSLEDYIPSYFASVKNYTITEAVQGEKIDAYEAVTTRISAELFTKVDDPVAGLFEAENVEPKLLVEHELTLVNYDGVMVLTDAMWRSGDPEYN